MEQTVKTSIRLATSLLLGLLLALFFLPSNNLFAQDTALNMRLKQRNAADNSDVDRFIAPPAPDASCLFFFNGATVRPACAALGSGLNLSGGTLTAATTGGSSAWSSITGTPTTLAGYGITDAVTNNNLSAALLPYVTVSQLTSSLASKFNAPNGTSAQYVRGDGILATLPTGAAAFNYGQPVARTIAGSTSYQALDPAKPAVVTISAACTNTSTLLASSACTVQVRQAQSAVTCSTGTVTMTWTSTVQLGVALTQNSGASMDVKLPIGGAFIACPVAGTFTISAVEQTAG